MVLNYVGPWVCVVLLYLSAVSHGFCPNSQVNFVEEFLNRAQLDGQLFESKVYQMMRRLSVYAYEDVQHTLSFFEKVATHFL